jgi:hypothetical protein
MLAATPRLGRNSPRQIAQRAPGHAMGKLHRERVDNPSGRCRFFASLATDVVFSLTGITTHLRAFDSHRG